MEFKLTVSKASFVTEKGEVLEYLQYEADILGETVRLYPKDGDKKLLNYLLKDKL